MAKIRVYYLGYINHKLLMDDSFDIRCELEAIRTNNNNFIWENNVTIMELRHFSRITPRNVSKTFQTNSLKLFVFVDVTVATFCPNVRTCIPRRKRPSILQIATGSKRVITYSNLYHATC